MGWSEERVARMRELWFLGKSATEIAKELGGVSRDAVIGKIHRLGLQRRRIATRKYVNPPKPARQRVAFMPQKKPARIVEQVKPVADAAEPQALYTLATDTGYGCRWICGDPRNATATVCGHAIHARHWCEHHHRRVYVAASTKKLKGMARIV